MADVRMTNDARYGGSNIRFLPLLVVRFAKRRGRIDGDIADHRGGGIEALRDVVFLRSGRVVEGTYDSGESRTLLHYRLVRYVERAVVAVERHHSTAFKTAGDHARRRRLSGRKHVD